MKNLIKTKFEEMDIQLSDNQINQFEKYINLLIEWNEKINLTAITDPEQVVLKHFIDSATIINDIPDNSKVVDIGSGAGFPGIVLKIINPTLKIDLIDSLDKRVKFLNELIKELSLEEIKALHGRAEDMAKKEEYREKYDIGTSRAVARLNILDELLLPFVKVNGKAILLKSSNAMVELDEAKNGINTLGGKLNKIDEFNLLGTDNKRVNLYIDKIKSTNNKYPRSFSKIKNKPL